FAPPLFPYTTLFRSRSAEAAQDLLDRLIRRIHRGYALALAHSRQRDDAHDRRGVGQVLDELIRGETGDGADEGSIRRDVEFVEDGGRLLRQDGENDEFAAVDDVLIAVTDRGGLEGLGEVLCAVGIAWGEEEPKVARVGVVGLTAGKAFDHRRGDLSDSDETDAGHLLLLERLSARLGVCSSDRIVSSTSEGLIDQ